MKNFNLVIFIVLILSCSAASASGKTWKKAQIIDTKGELISDTYTLKFPNGFCQVNVLPDKKAFVHIEGQGSDYSNSTKNTSVQIDDCFNVIDDGYKIRKIRELKISIIADNTEQSFPDAGHKVFSGECAKYIKGSNLPIVVQELLKELE